MIRLNSILGILGAGVLVLAVSTLTQAQVGKGRSDSKVKMDVATKTAGGVQMVAINLQIEKHWHIYANPVGSEAFEGTQTIVKIMAKGAPVNAKIDYPQGKEFEVAGIGKFRVYEDKVTILATVQRAPGDSGPLDLVVRVNACDDKNCLPPGTLKATIPAP